MWLGRKTLKIQKQAALAFVQKYVEIFDRPYFTGMTRVLESAEPAIFRSKFADWNSAAPGIVDYGHSFKTARKAEMPTSAPLEFNVGDLYAPPRDLKVRRIRNTDDTRPVSQKCYFDGTRYVSVVRVRACVCVPVCACVCTCACVCVCTCFRTPPPS